MLHVIHTPVVGFGRLARSVVLTLEAFFLKAVAAIYAIPPIAREYTESIGWWWRTGVYRLLWPFLLLVRKESSSWIIPAHLVFLNSIKVGIISMPGKRQEVTSI